MLPFALNAQRGITVQVTDKEEGTPIEGATVIADKTDIATFTDSNGVAVISQIPDSVQGLTISYIGYFRKKVKLPATHQTADTLRVKLETQREELEEVVIVSTRNDKRNEEIPTRIEAITDEEVEERSHDKPSDVSHVLREQPGVQVQRTSATGGTMSIRLQGLSGRYVQVLKDGFPQFGGFSSVIGITQIPPLDLRQVEIIKGPSSTLYGADAISGVINLISKEPTEKPVYDIMVNAESVKAVDAGLYASQRFKWFAFVLTGLYRYQTAKDWDGDNFSETPKLQRYNISPQLFFYIGKHAKLNVGAGYTHEDRLGGTLQYINGKPDSVYNYYEKNLSDHLTTNCKFEYDFEKSGKLTLKNSVNYFMRSLQLPYYLFDGNQLATYTELNYHLSRKKHDVVIGFDYRTDRFKEGSDSATDKRDYDYQTGGFFINYMFRLDDKTTFEGGLRLDYNNVYKVNGLPHLGIKHKWNDVFITRFNGGMGYKLPNAFQDESEEARFINVRPLGDSVKPELSVGGTVDLLVKAPSLNGFNIAVNQMYFITHIFRPLLGHTTNIEGCTTGDCNEIVYSNAKGYRQSRGIETSLKMSYRGANAQLTYVLTDNNLKVNDVRSIAPLTSKHIISIFAGYETKVFGAGIDCYYYSPVKLSDGSISKSIWEVGVNVQVSLKYILLFANLENILDIRQTSFGRVVQGDPTYSHPQFKEIYAPLEGRLFNAGFKLRLGAFSKKYGTNAGVEHIRGKDDD
jgi:iron complex outermembrane receptor protein